MPDQGGRERRGKILITGNILNSDLRIVRRPLTGNLCRILRDLASSASNVAFIMHSPSLFIERFFRYLSRGQVYIF